MEMMETNVGDSAEPGDFASESPESPQKGGRRPSDKERSERDKRTYRACLHCRQRKSRCDLYSSGEPGRPPCERCIREQHECILGGSRRGGRRVKRSTSDVAAMVGPTEQQRLESVQPMPLPTPGSQYNSPHVNDQRLPMWGTIDRESRMLPPLPQEPPTQTSTPNGSRLTVDDTVASHDLQNPADALEFLAHVAERDSGSNHLPHLPPMQHSAYGPSPRRPPTSNQFRDTPRSSYQPPSGNPIDFPPLNKGHLTLDTIQTLLLRYEDKYHQFFPLANPMAFDIQNLSIIAAKEPHLLTAILTVASKDEKMWWQWHETCSAHMMQLIAELVYSGGGTVEAVEAMLILAEWVPRRPHSTPTVGRGEEDQAAWMYVGTAIRLGYLLGIDRSGFRIEGEAQSADLNRKRLAWAACYMSDRQISVRIGKAFWSRGPGPMTALRAQDFPSLQPRPGRPQDDFAAIFQANLELTQLFSNAHDVLYATKSRSNQLNFGGEYVKYIDDFRVALRSWHSTWGVFTCSPPLKASLILSYEYLRLYINAFAYQATLNRLVAQAHSASTNGPQPHSPTYPFSDIAATPDARFIYDSIDAAKSLLSTFNSFVSPGETFRFMPLRYYLYVIYSACFLYKARSTGVMGGDTKGAVKRMITDTVDNLQKASACANDVGERYSRLIRLLWRKPPGRGSVAEIAEIAADITRPSSTHPQVAGPVNHTSQQHHDQAAIYEAINNAPSINTFSWLDLPAVGDFATQNNSISGSMDSFDRYEDSSADGYGGFDQHMMMPQQFAWNGISPTTGIIF
ncbi:hypothetical protein LTR56_005052 [Elasticomyces elasticus]|nr:hypothetical protein LTR56_005052 [Elasticomyces elasticus]KAK3655874.1 hypothetical protein LTR22_010032 [Elasticomyces elasticus]KAK4912601.1 hypothetical protein LTR49_018963 [Elasticomyces elasticus]KAK5752077.1 hypothetical protein LTS12_017840 [Elasticomyces elasticus]